MKLISVLPIGVLFSGKKKIWGSELVKHCARTLIVGSSAVYVLKKSPCYLSNFKYRTFHAKTFFLSLLAIFCGAHFHEFHFASNLLVESTQLDHQRFTPSPLFASSFLALGYVSTYTTLCSHIHLVICK